MNRIIKGFLIIVGATLVLFIGYMAYCRMVFSGVFDKKISREEVQENFVKNEEAFNNLVTYFDVIVPTQDPKLIQVWLSEKKDCYTIFITPLSGPITPSNQAFGGKDLSIADPLLDSVAGKLNWTKKNIRDLTDLLQRTNCKSICTTSRQECYSLFYGESGWGVFEYHIFKEALTAEQKEISGNPIGDTGLGSRTVIRYLAPL